MGYPGLVLLMAIGSACIPVPSEIILPFAGYLVTQGSFTLPGVVIAGVIGDNIGSAIGYEIGRRGGRPLMERYGRYVLIDTHHIDQAERFFARFGHWAVMVGRCTPLVRAFVALPAGAARMSRLKFHIFTTLGATAWCTALALLGRSLGAAWNTDPRLREAFHRADIAILALLIVAVTWFVWHRLRRN